MALYRLYKNRTGKQSQKLLSSNGHEKAMVREHESPVASPSSSRDMPFTESKHISEAPPTDEEDSDLDIPSMNDDDAAETRHRNAPASALASYPVDIKQKKRKRGPDLTTDSPLILHVVSDRPENQPQLSALSLPAPNSSNPSAGASKRPKTMAPSTKKISKRIAGGGRASGIEHPGGGRKGISSGLSTVIRGHGVKQVTGRRAAVAANGRGDARSSRTTGGADWWSKL